jgi:hypothetical protein
VLHQEGNGISSFVAPEAIELLLLDDAHSERWSSFTVEWAAGTVVSTGTGKGETILFHDFFDACHIKDFFDGFLANHCVVGI